MNPLSNPQTLRVLTAALALALTAAPSWSAESQPAKAAAATVVTAKSEPSARSEQNAKRGRSNARSVPQKTGRTVVQTGGAHGLANAAMRAVKTIT